ncbi:twinkle protein, mitochondrial [Nilaparvata lugens]|uniref:twinkle protein, mitochondrial n=1 Tax=Nilaparvata lugens TaxID=108931 RepID=UPI00193E554C|nr:twinkle protein, mitochondrial [Nilaparvata lugens]
MLKHSFLFNCSLSSKIRISKAFSDLNTFLRRYDAINQLPLVFKPCINNYSSLNWKRTCLKVSCKHKLNHSQVNNFHDVPNDKFSAASIAQVKSVLECNKIEFTEGFSSLIIKCPICVSMKRTELYINKVTGHTVCKGCKRTGDWNDLQSALTSKSASEKESETSEKISEQDHPLKKYDNVAGEKWKALSKTSQSLLSMSSDERREAMQRFTSKEISEDVIKQLDAHIMTGEDGSKTFVVPLKQSSSDVVGFKQIGQDGSELVEPCRNCRGILTYKSKPTRKDATAVIVHSFKDFLALANLQLYYHIICLPYGITSLPQDILPLLERYKKIVLWFGNGSGSWDAARQFAKKLNEGRCFFVSLACVSRAA